VFFFFAPQPFFLSPFRKLSPFLRRISRRPWLQLSWKEQEKTVAYRDLALPPSFPSSILSFFLAKRGREASCREIRFSQKVRPCFLY